MNYIQSLRSIKTTQLLYFLTFVLENMTSLKFHNCSTNTHTVIFYYVCATQIQAINQLGMLQGYTTTTTTVGQQQVTTVDLITDDEGGGGGVDLQASRGSKESRRSWTSKHKPHTCQHPGCRKSYFFVHDLRRHLRQKHDGMDYNDRLGKYEPASEGEGMGEGDLGHESPLDRGHHEGMDGVGETDDGSPDESDDNEEDTDLALQHMAGSGGGVGGGKTVVT